MTVPAPQKSQYHHFVPRFILKNFAHPFRPPGETVCGRSKDSKRHNRRRRNKNVGYPDEPMLNIANFDGVTASIVESPVAKTLGMTDMYRDIREGAKNQHHLEEKLSKLESQAGMVVSKIRKSFEAGGKDVWITRPERDTLRKFLFIMKYRGLRAYKRFYHNDGQAYSEDDRERMLLYMKKGGFKTPFDVWLDNINAMLDMKMDPQLKWMQWLREHAYPDDAAWFIMHCQMMYLALCTPSSPEDEIILTENAYSIHEGPVSPFLDPVTKKMTQGSYTELHLFAPVSPKLIMVLRSFVLPVPEEDANEEVRVWRESMLEQVKAQHDFSQPTDSLLEDLPIRKARTSYTRIVDGRLDLLDGEDGSRRASDKFNFQFFPISTEHTNRINFIMLENAHSISTIVFKTQMAMCRTLRDYLTAPCEFNGVPCFKQVEGTQDDQRLNFLRKLEKILSNMGSKATVIYGSAEGQPGDPLVLLGQMLKQKFPNEPDDSSEFMQLYGILGSTHTYTVAIAGDLLLTILTGGNLITLPKDMDQAAKMLNMRIKIDVWSKGLSNARREDIREKLAELFCQLPARRVWLYLKRTRLMLRVGARNWTDQSFNPTKFKKWRKGEDAEDHIIEGKFLISRGILRAFI